MANVVKLKPTSPGRRFVVRPVRPKELHKGQPYGPLVKNWGSKGGRNNKGRITVDHRGGGHKRKYRQIDFKRDKIDVPGRVERIEYDPNRTPYLALVVYQDGERRYIIAPKGIAIGDSIISSREAPAKQGNCLPIRNIPLHAKLHAVELEPGKGAQLARSAGSYISLVSREGEYATLRLPSSELRRVSVECKATIGVAGNSDHNLRSLGKAGAKRWRGKRPTVRGVAMNPVDHPHGGGEGKTGRKRPPVNKKGKLTKGFKTRNNKRTDSRIIARRKK